jgi:hypothetical protein
MLNKEILQKSLKLLGTILDREQTEPMNLVVCGGSALLFCEYVSRTTQDVDVVGLGYGEQKIGASNPLPDLLKKASVRVSQDLGLDENWLNSGPSDGSKLTIHFLDRYDQIHLKVYACVDSGPGRHLDDLRVLKPSNEEMQSAALWAMKQDPSSEFRETLLDMMRKIGYGTVADKL